MITLIKYLLKTILFIRYRIVTDQPATILVNPFFTLRMDIQKLLYFIFICLDYSISFDYSTLQVEIKAYLQTNTQTGVLKNKIDQFYKSESGPEKDKASCELCRIVANATISLQKTGGSEMEIRAFASDMCSLFLPSSILECNRYVDNLINAWMYIVDNKLDLTPENVCRIRLQEQNCFTETDSFWHIILPEGSSKPLPELDNTVQHKIMHISDIHYDPLYKVGSAAVCNDLLCCESISGEPNSHEEAAGYWGDYHACDMPWYSVENLMQQVKQYNASWVYFTGDMITHQIGITSPSRNTDMIKKLMQALRNTFSNIPIYGILGNHEPHPANAFSPENITRPDLSTQWLFDLMAQEWGQWLNEAAKITIRKGGYYSILISPGLRLIALNSNVCYINNVWLLYDDKDPYNQLQWLSDTLLVAERNNEAVHILTHIAAGETTCLKQWNHEYRRIVERFQKTITAQFTGHSHFEGIKVFYNKKKIDEVINIAFNGGSFTTFVGNNPNFKMYDIQGNHYKVADYEVWTYDLSAANRNNTKPKWFKLYSFKNTYDVENLNEYTYDVIIKRLAHDKNLLETYRRLGSRNGTASLNKCNLKCWRDTFCRITQIENEESDQCKWFEKHKFL